MSNEIDKKKLLLPDYYKTAAQDLIEYCAGDNRKIWIDLGCGPGDIGLTLLEKLDNITMVLMDPDSDALDTALISSRQRSVLPRTVTVLGSAETIPMPDNSVDAVVSRGSFYFWQDRVKGLKEIWRVLRNGGRAMIGGGLGKNYPEWARREFIRRQRASQEKTGPEAMKKFLEARNPDTFRRLAVKAGLPAFAIIGEGGLSEEDPNAGMGIWLQFEKGESNE
ncbi:MAG: class I SAM-dependent methyltransferase [Fibrobacterota bacterium]